MSYFDNLRSKLDPEISFKISYKIDFTISQILAFTVHVYQTDNDMNYKLPRIIDGADPTPFDFQIGVYQRGLKFEKPPLSFEPTIWEAQAEKQLSANAWGYVHGSAGSRQTDDNNLAAFKKWAFIPRRLVPAGFPDLSVTLFGKDYPYPVAIAPVGVQKIFNDEGELATTRAAEKEHVPYILSTASSVGLEEAATSNGAGQRWFQLYWPDNDHNNITASLLSRAKKAGYDVLVVTLDTYITGWRASDMDNGYSPFLRPDSVGVALGFTDPVYRQIFKEKYGKEIEEDMETAAATWAKIFIPGFSHSWEDITFLKKHWDGPIVLKGIQSVEDAKKAVEVGVQGIIVSNHGGRQCDGGVGSLETLPEIADAVGNKLEIIFDSGIRCGMDVAKALALGAKMVLIGRPFVWGLALCGEEGVRHVLKSFLGELSLSLHLTGIPSVGKEYLNRSIMRKIS
jgi:lactate 2-monooxygenase